MIVETYLIIVGVCAIAWLGNMVFATFDLRDDLLNHHNRIPRSKHYFRRSIAAFPIVFLWPLLPFYFLGLGAKQFVVISKIAFQPDED